MMLLRIYMWIHLIRTISICLNIFKVFTSSLRNNLSEGWRVFACLIHLQGSVYLLKIIDAQLPVKWENTLYVPYLSKALPYHLLSSGHILTTFVIIRFEQLIFRSKHLRGVDEGEIIWGFLFLWVNNSLQWKDLISPR